MFHLGVKNFKQGSEISKSKNLMKKQGQFEQQTGLDFKDLQSFKTF